jgi:hypothetical protein
LAVPLPEITRHQIETKLSAFCDKKVPPYARSQVQIVFTIRGYTVTLYEKRPYFKDPSVFTESKVAQFRLHPTSAVWTLYCRDRNGRWCIYEPATPGKNFDTLLAEVERDPTCIFWG